MAPPATQNVERWGAGEVQTWLEQEGFYAFKEGFELGAVDGDGLLKLSETDLRNVLGVEPAAERERLLGCLRELWADWSESKADADMLQDQDSVREATNGHGEENGHMNEEPDNSPTDVAYPPLAKKPKLAPRSKAAASPRSKFGGPVPAQNALQQRSPPPSSEDAVEEPTPRPPPGPPPKGLGKGPPPAKAPAPRGKMPATAKAAKAGAIPARRMV
mmetsp:Transcript_47981/g.95464  ORF Transcript_47981/g.95464 Transcript_47981/m.95464 type:complete len:217 (-) Transcript_47981:19-669(-)